MESPISSLANGQVISLPNEVEPQNYPFVLKKKLMLPLQWATLTTTPFSLPHGFSVRQVCSLQDEKEMGLTVGQGSVWEDEPWLISSTYPIH